MKQQPDARHPEEPRYDPTHAHLVIVSTDWNFVVRRQLTGVSREPSPDVARDGPELCRRAAT
jgi:hypothetical protein